MNGLFKNPFSPGDHGQMSGPDKDFDRLMKNVEEDEAVLFGIENMVHHEFEEIDEEVKNIKEIIDKVLGKIAG